MIYSLIPRSCLLANSVAIESDRNENQKRRRLRVLKDSKRTRKGILLVNRGRAMMIANGGTADGGNRCAIYIPASERMIMLVPDQIQILICTEPIDMRKGADSLAGVVRDSLSEEPLSGTLFVFRGKR